MLFTRYQSHTSSFTINILPFVFQILEQHRHILQNGGINVNPENDADMEQHTDSSGSEERMVNRTLSSSFSEEKNVADSIQTENLGKNFNVCDKSLDKNQNVQNGEIVDYRDGENLDGGTLDESILRETSKIVQRDKAMTKNSDGEKLNKTRSGNDNFHIDKTVNRNLETEMNGDLQGDFTDSSHNESKSSQREIDSSQREITKHKPNERELLQREFEKLRTFAHEVVPRPLYEEVKMDEQVEQEPVIEEFDKVQIRHEESQEEFSSRFFTYDKVHDPENRALPDFSYFDNEEEHDFGFNEIDPDLLSMNLAPIVEETEEELEEDKDEETLYEQDWRGNWIFKGNGIIVLQNCLVDKDTV